MFYIIDDDSDEHTAIVDYILSQLSLNSNYIRFSKSRSNPASASACVNKYLQVAGLVNNLLGTKTPLDLADAPGTLIAEVSCTLIHDIISSLTINQTHLCSSLGLSSIWWDECFKTLRLLSLFGPRSKHYEDIRVQGLLDSKSYQNTPRIKLLKLLESIYSTWVGDHK